MMPSAQWHRELVAAFASEGAVLGKTQMMRVAGLAPANRFAGQQIAHGRDRECAAAQDNIRMDLSTEGDDVADFGFLLRPDKVQE